MAHNARHSSPQRRNTLALNELMKKSHVHMRPAKANRRNEKISLKKEYPVQSLTKAGFEQGMLDDATSAEQQA